MEETVYVVSPLSQGVWRGCSSRRVVKQLPSCRHRSAARSLTVAAPRARLPLAQEGERRVVRIRVYVFVFEKNFGGHRKQYTDRNFAVFR